MIFNHFILFFHSIFNIFVTKSSSIVMVQITKHYSLSDVSFAKSVGAIQGSANNELDYPTRLPY